MTTERLRVGIDGDALRKPMSGVGQYIYQLCRELEALLPEAELYAYSRLSADRLALPSTRWVLRQEQSPVWRKLPSFIWLKTRGARLCRRDRCLLGRSHATPSLVRAHPHGGYGARPESPVGP